MAHGIGTIIIGMRLWNLMVVKLLLKKEKLMLAVTNPINEYGSKVPLKEIAFNFVSVSLFLIKYNRILIGA